MSGIGVHIILVILGGLALALATVSGRAGFASALDIQQARAYQAARAGMEWGIFQAAGGGCAASSQFTGGTAFPGFSDFTIKVTCVSTAVTEGGNSLTVMDITSLACNAASCPAATPQGLYAERKMTAQVAR